MKTMNFKFKCHIETSLDRKCCLFRSLASDLGRDERRVGSVGKVSVC